MTNSSFMNGEFKNSSQEEIIGESLEEKRNKLYYDRRADKYSPHRQTTNDKNSIILLKEDNQMNNFLITRNSHIIRADI